jgi:hypothetical protein
METIMATLKSDYDPDTFMRIVITDCSDVAIKIYGKGEFKIAGYGGGGYLKPAQKIVVTKSFRDIVDILNKEPESEKAKGDN